MQGLQYFENNLLITNLLNQITIYQIFTLTNLFNQVIENLQTN